MENLNSPSSEWTEHQWYEFYKNLEKLEAVGHLASSTSVEASPIPEMGELRPLPLRKQGDSDNQLPQAA